MCPRTGPRLSFVPCSEQGRFWCPGFICPWGCLGRDPQLLGTDQADGQSLWGGSITGATGAVPTSRGLIVLSSNTSYYLRPLGTPEPGLHLIHRAEHLPMPGGTCGHGQDLASTMAGIAQLFQPQHPRVNPLREMLMVNSLREVLMVNSLREILMGKSSWVNPHR